MFAHAVYVGDHKWNLTEASDILVTLSEELNIIIPANKANPAIYIDVPLESILEVCFDTSLVLDSQQPTYGLVIKLKSEARTGCMINATEYAEQHTAVVFSSEKEAKTLGKLLMPTNFRMNGLPPHTRSEATNASEQILSDDELSAPGRASSNNRILMRTASLASAIIPHEDGVNTINPSRLERVPTSQRAFSEHQEGWPNSILEHDEDPQNFGHIVDIAAQGIDVSENVDLVDQAIEGIDISHVDGLSYEEIQDQDIHAHIPGNASSNTRVHYPQAPNCGKQENVGIFNRTPGTGPSSSLQRHTALKAVQSVPDFRTRPYQQAVSPSEQVENKRSPKVHDGAHDDLYYASPKVTKGQRRSPRLLARYNTPEELERPLQPTVPQESAKTAPPIKLSRQLRNADGVVRSHMEPTTGNGYTALVRSSAGDAKTSTNGKKSKALTLPKARTATKRSTKTGKKIAQSKAKAIATEEVPNTSFEEYGLPPSPKQVKSTIQTSGNRNAMSSRLKPIEAPLKDQKKAKLMPRKAPTTASFEGSAPKPRKGLKDKGRANGSAQDSIPKRLSGKEINDDDDAIWDVVQAHSEEEPQTLKKSRQLAKTGNKQETRVPKTAKYKAETQLHPDIAKANKSNRAQTQEQTPRLVKTKPTLTALSQSRPQRTAAIKANKKIQDLVLSDEIVDDEEVVSTLPYRNGHTTQITKNVSRKEKAKDGGDDRPRTSRKLPASKFSTKSSVPDSVSRVSPEEQATDSVADPNAHRSPENVSLAKDAPAKALRATPGDKRDNLQKENLNSATETSMIPKYPLGSDPKKPSPTSIKTYGGLVEAGVDMVPDSVPQLDETITETDPIPPCSQQHKTANQGNKDMDATESSGFENQGQLPRALPCIDDVSLKRNTGPDRVKEDMVPPQAPTAPTTVKITQRRTSPRLAEAARSFLPKPTSTKRDPFSAKLNASLLELKDTGAKVESREGAENVNGQIEGENTSTLAGLARPSKESKARALDENGVTPHEKANHVKSRRRHLYSAMQVDGDGEYSLRQSLKPTYETQPTPRIEPKRKSEQVGDSSNKKVKMAPRELLEEVSAKRKRAYNEEKTPPPVVSNRPLMIGFSATGPRNQGTISTKKPRSPKDVRTNTPHVSKLRKHEVSIFDQVEAGFSSAQEELGNPLEDIQNKAKNAGSAQKETRGSPPRKQAEHLGTVDAVATRQAHAPDHRPEKRKLVPFVEEYAPGEHEPFTKRHKREIVTPPTAQIHHPKMLPDISPALFHDRSQRLHSQNTRVDENGSPMPCLITRNDSTAADEQYSDEDDGKDALPKARLEELCVLQDDDLILPEPIHSLPPRVSAVSKSRRMARAYQTLSNNSKQVPSSPHASSAFGMMPAHHLYHDGEIVNAETKESIVPMNPQDPFLGATRKPRNSFMDAIRKSSELAAERLVPRANEREKSGGAVMQQAINVGEDPDKTLVEPNLKKRHNQIRVSDSSSSSSSLRSGSSIQVLQSDESSEEESDSETEAKWRKGLEPHQENMLECLLRISHVSNDLYCLYSRALNQASAFDSTFNRQRDRHQTHGNRLYQPW